MKYFKNIENGYIVSVSTNYGQTEITKKHYEDILLIIKTIPPTEDGYEYKLREDFTWEKVKIVDENQVLE